MIRLTTPTSSGYITEYVAAANVARITEADAASQWHGIRSIVRLLDGGVIECNETADSIRKMVEAAPQEQTK